MAEDHRAAINGMVFHVDGCVMHPGSMGEIFPMPRLGDVFADVRDDGRTMRISSHGDKGAVVVSLWHGTLCRGSFRMAADDVDRLMSTLVEIRASIRTASAATQELESSPPEGTGLDPATESTPDLIEPPVERTGDVTGTANSGRLPSSPVLRVA